MSEHQNYRVSQSGSIFNFYGSVAAAVRYLDELTIDGVPGREVGAVVEKFNDLTGEWVEVPTSRRHLHNSRKSGWRECHRANCGGAAA